jgi:hypothetical protein
VGRRIGAPPLLRRVLHVASRGNHDTLPAARTAAAGYLPARGAPPRSPRRRRRIRACSNVLIIVRLLHCAAWP